MSNSDIASVDTTPLCDGRFVLFGILGAGSHGQTYDAVDRKNGRAVAIKRFDVARATCWKDVELAEREATVLSTLNHPSLPAYIHHFEEKGVLYLVTEKIEGKDLSTLLRLGKRFTLEELRQLVETLADIFDYLHRRLPPVVHRDIKPSNIVQREDASFCLIDFGSVRDGLRPEGGSTVVGTFGYMAPEQFQGRAMPATDLYGAGATLLTLMTGIAPDQLPHRGLEVDVRRALPVTTPHAWVELLERLLTVDPDKRAVNLKLLVPTLREPQSSVPGQTPPASSQASNADGDSALIDRQSEWIFGAGTTIPFALVVILSLLRVLLYLLLQVALPLVLTLLSAFFGRRLRDTAAEVTRAGTAANRQLSSAIEKLAGMGPLVVRRQHRVGPPHRAHPRPFDERSGRAGTRSRRVRVGNFDVELPTDPNSETTRTGDNKSGRS